MYTERDSNAGLENHSQCEWGSKDPGTEKQTSDIQHSFFKSTHSQSGRLTRVEEGNPGKICTWEGETMLEFGDEKASYRQKQTMTDSKREREKTNLGGSRGGQEDHDRVFARP